MAAQIATPMAAGRSPPRAVALALLGVFLKSYLGDTGPYQGCTGLLILPQSLKNRPNMGYVGRVAISGIENCGLGLIPFSLGTWTLTQELSI